MANYKQATVSGTSWRRSPQVIVSNPYLGVPAINFSEEDLMVIDGQVLSMPPGRDVLGVGCEFNPTESFPLVHPETGESLNSSITHQEFYVVLHSLYMHLVKQRDERLNPPVEEPPVAPVPENPPDPDPVELTPEQ